MPLPSLSTARSDAPTRLPNPAVIAPAAVATKEVMVAKPSPTRPHDSINDGNLPVIIGSALRQHIEMNPSDKNEIIARVAGLRTRADAAAYLASVSEELRIRGFR